MAVGMDDGILDMKGFSVYPRKGRPNWYICYFSADEFRWVSRSTPYALDDPGGEKKATKLGESLAREFERKATATRAETWMHWARPFIEHHYQKQEKTRRRYINAWDWLQVFLQEKKLLTPGAVQYKHAQQYIDWRMTKRRHCGRPIARNTALVELRVLSLLMREAVRRGYVVANSLAQLGLTRDAAKEKPELADDEITKIRQELAKREAAKPITERWMTVSFEIALHQGCRLSETSLPMSRVDEKRRTIQFHAKGRNGQPHVFTTALHPGLVDLITTLRQAGATDTCHLPPMAAKEWWKFRRDVGLGHTTFHSTRVTAITRMARANVPQAQAMRFVGHANEAVHRIYQKLKVEDLSACTAALDFSSPRKAGTQGDPAAKS